MTHYKISKEELEAFAKKVYEEACYGYLDLKDSVCGGMVRDFLDGRKIVPPIDTNIMSGPPPMPATTGYMGHVGPPYTGTAGMYTGSAGTFTYGGDTTVTINVAESPPIESWEVSPSFGGIADSINELAIPSSVATGRDSDNVSLYGTQGTIHLRSAEGNMILNEDIQLRSEDILRPEPNFQGNESERF
jgi:hypothetical protein